jgi:hypothetical protein
MPDNTDYSVYRYFKGEKENPYSIILDKAEKPNKAKTPY